MLIKKFWRLYPQSSNRTEISTRRKKISKKKEQTYKNLIKNILMAVETMGMEGTIMIKSFLEK